MNEASNYSVQHKIDNSDGLLVMYTLFYSIWDIDFKC